MATQIPAQPPPSEATAEVRQRLLQTASELFYQNGVRAIGVDAIVAAAGVAKTSLYRYFPTKDDLIAAFLAREDEDFWRTWNEAAAPHASDPMAELNAHLDWIGERISRDAYRGCPQLNVAAEFADPNHPARQVARQHKHELHHRLKDLATRIGSSRPEVLATELTLLVNGAFVSSEILVGQEAATCLRHTAAALVAARL